jgi:hypothetical protein
VTGSGPKAAGNVRPTHWLRRAVSGGKWLGWNLHRAKARNGRSTAQSRRKEQISQSAHGGPHPPGSLDPTVQRGPSAAKGREQRRRCHRDRIKRERGVHHRRERRGGECEHGKAIPEQGRRVVRRGGSLGKSSQRIGSQRDQRRGIGRARRITARRQPETG